MLSPSQQCSSTPVGLGEGFLSNEQSDNIGASLIRFDLAPADFYLLPRLKSALKGRCFFFVTDIIKNAMEELKRFSQNFYQEYFQHLYNHW